MADPDELAWPATSPLDLRLTAGDAQLVVDLRGAALRSLDVGGRQVLDGYPAGAVPDGFKGAVLLPWCNRVRDGRWTWRDRDLQLDIGGPAEPHALHGLLVWQRWTVLARQGSTATLGTVVEARPGYPFRLAAALDLDLAPDRLAVRLRARNDADVAAPFSAGLHPYLSVGATEDGGIAQAELEVPARTALELDGGLPTGGRRPFDGHVGRIGERALDDAVTDLERDDDGWARAVLTGPAGRVELAVDGSWPWLQVYTGDMLPAGQHRRSLAVEPMTGPPNALADGVDLVVLAPGEAWSGSATLSWTSA